MSNTIATNIKMTGVEEYKNNAKKAANSIKSLRAEMKEAESQYRLTGDAEEYQKAKTKNLQEQIEQQKKVVESLKNAMEQMKKNGTDTGDAYEAMRRKIAYAQTTLNNMTADLKKTTEDFQTGKEEVENYSDTLNNIDRNVSFSNITSGIDKITSKLTNAAKKALALAKSVWQGGVDASNWADDILTRSVQQGVDAETIQRWDFAELMVDTNVSSIQSGKARIAAALNAAGVEIGEDYATFTDGMIDTTETGEDFYSITGETANKIETLGVSIRDANGDLRDMNDIFFDTIDALNKIENPTEQALKAQEIFGKSYQSLIPLISAGSGAWNDAMNEALVLDNERVASLGTFNDELNRMNNAIDTAKMEAFAALAPSFTEIAQGITSIMEDFTEFVKSPEGNEALSSLGTAISDLFRSLTGQDENGENGFTKVVNLAKDAVSGLTNALEWISDNKEGVVEALKAVAAGFALLKVSETVLTFVNGAKNIKTLFGGSPTGTPAAPAAAPVSPVVTPVAAKPSFMDKVGEALAKGGSLGGFTGALASAGLIASGVSAIAGAIASYRDVQDGIEASAKFDNIYGDLFSRNIFSTLGTRVNGGKTLSTLFNAVANPSATKDSMAAMIASVEAYKANHIEDLSATGGTALEAYWDAVREAYMTGASSGSVDSALVGLEESFTGFDDELERAKDIISQALGYGSPLQGFENIPDKVWDALETALGGVALRTGAASGTKNQPIQMVLPDNVANEIQHAVHSGIVGVQVYLDGEAVGRMVAPAVSGEIAGGIYSIGE